MGGDWEKLACVPLHPLRPQRDWRTELGLWIPLGSQGACPSVRSYPWSGQTRTDLGVRGLQSRPGGTAMASCVNQGSAQQDTGHVRDCGLDF